jgi:catechol 2,3-dioxygenase-like lactoylglutathione lyase family enzyme
MAINGVQSLIYGVDDLDTSTRFYEDFGLSLDRRDATGSDFSTVRGETILLRRRDDTSLPPDVLENPAVREMIWGVDTKASLDALEKNLSSDRKVTKDATGTLHTVDDVGIPIGFRVFTPKPLTFEQVPTNTPTDVRRWNANRKWYGKATPKLIHHIGYGVPKRDVQKLVDFYVKRLNFRITDVSRGFAVFLLADGRQDHHSIFIIMSEALQSAGLLWNHVSFGVENIDEVVAGANYLQRRKWVSRNGLSRHRISSAINFYAVCPAGGEAEYLTDTDFVDKDWKPRMWDPRFGVYMWNAEVPDFMLNEPAHDVSILEGPIPEFTKQ